MNSVPLNALRKPIATGNRQLRPKIRRWLSLRTKRDCFSARKKIKNSYGSLVAGNKIDFSSE